jgi:hypothetical protein
MKELLIYEYQAKQIEDTLRIVANILGSRTKETSADRDIMQSIGMIKAVIEENPQKQVFR